MYDLRPSRPARPVWLSFAIGLLAILVLVAIVLTIISYSAPFTPARPPRILATLTPAHIAIVTVASVKQIVLVPTLTPIPTDTPVDTATPEPTLTPTLTLTPAPTDTPIATDTDTPTAEPTRINIRTDPVAQAYISGLTSALDFYTEGSKIVGEQSVRLGATPELLIDKDWQINMAIGLSELTLSSQAIRKLTPPVYMIDAHTELLGMADHIDNAVNLWSEGFKKVDVAKIREGTSEYKLSSASMDSSKEKIDAFVKNNEGN